MRGQDQLVKHLRAPLVACQLALLPTVLPALAVAETLAFVNARLPPVTTINPGMRILDAF